MRTGTHAACRWRVGLAAVAALAGAAGGSGGGCALKPKAPMAGERASATVSGPFAPASLDVHPLTRVALDERGRAMIVCHIEMRDAWGDTCKSTGRLRVQLYRAAGGAGGAGLGVQELAWDVDLSDLERQRLWDAPTRTYRLELEGAPAWLLEAGPGGDAPGRLRALLDAAGPAGEPRQLSAERAVGGPV